MDFLRRTAATITAAAAALAAAVTPAIADPAPSPREHLIDGCTWAGEDPAAAGWVQTCMVDSPANGRPVRVDVIAARTAGSPHVVQLLDGLAPGTDHNEWMTRGGVPVAAGGVDATFVAPVAPDYSMYMDFSRPRGGEVIQMATFVTRELPAWLADHGVAGGGVGHTAAMGISAGAFAAVNLAAAAPELYSGVYALSGFYNLDRPAERAVVNAGRRAGLDTDALWGPYETNRQAWLEHSPVHIIDRVTAPVLVASATGVTDVAADEPAALADIIVAGGALEAASARSSRDLSVAAAVAGKTNLEQQWLAVGSHTWSTWRAAAWRDGGFARLAAAAGIPVGQG